MVLFHDDGTQEWSYQHEGQYACDGVSIPMQLPAREKTSGEWKYEGKHQCDDCCSKDGIGYSVDEHLSEKRLPFALLGRRGMAHREMIQYVDESLRQMLLHDLIRRCGKANHIRSKESRDDRYGNNYWIEIVADNA